MSIEGGQQEGPGVRTIALVEEAFQHLHDPYELAGPRFAPLRAQLMKATNRLALRDSPEAVIGLQESLRTAALHPFRLLSPFVTIGFSISFGWMWLSVQLGDAEPPQQDAATTLMRFPSSLARPVAVVLHDVVRLRHQDVALALNVDDDTARRLVYSGRANAAFCWIALNGVSDE